MDGTFDFLRRRLLRRGDSDITGPLDFTTKFGTGPLAALVDGAGEGVGPLAALIGDAARAADAPLSLAPTPESDKSFASEIRREGRSAGAAFDCVDFAFDGAELVSDDVGFGTPESAACTGADSAYCLGMSTCMSEISDVVRPFIVA